MSASNRWFPDESFYTDEKCRSCGVCCGSTDGDPCEHLRREGDSYSCEAYATRLGPHRTLLGHMITCVTIQRVIETMGGYEGCAYVEEIKRNRLERAEPVDDLGRSRVPEE